MSKNISFLNKINFYLLSSIYLIGLHALDLEDIKSNQFKKLVFNKTPCD